MFLLECQRYLDSFCFRLVLSGEKCIFHKYTHTQSRTVASIVCGFDSKQKGFIYSVVIVTSGLVFSDKATEKTNFDMLNEVKCILFALETSSLSSFSMAFSMTIKQCLQAMQLCAIKIEKNISTPTMHDLIDIDGILLNATCRCIINWNDCKIA